MKKGKIHLGITPSYDLSGKLVSNINFNNVIQEMSITIEKGLKVQNVKMTYQKAFELGFINLEVLDYYFQKM